MEYTIIINSRPESLEALVNEAIAEGWVPLGGLAISEDAEYIRYGQAMTREPKPVIQPSQVPKTA